jgi:hypothetical protein
MSTNTPSFWGFGSLFFADCGTSVLRLQRVGLSSSTRGLLISHSHVPSHQWVISGTVKALAAEGGNGRPSVSKPSEMVVCFGEMLIDFVPTVGGLSLAKAPAFKKAPGGAPANVAVGIARLGGAAAFMGKVCNQPRALFDKLDN